MKLFRFSWSQRLHGRKTFAHVIRQGRRLEHEGLRIWICPQTIQPAQASRIGLAIPKRFGNAVVRNRLKRLIRETFRLNQHGLLPGWDMVFSTSRPIQPLTYATISQRVLLLWKKAGVCQPSSSV